MSSEISTRTDRNCESKTCFVCWCSRWALFYYPLALIISPELFMQDSCQLLYTGCCPVFVDRLALLLIGGPINHWTAAEEREEKASQSGRVVLGRLQWKPLRAPLSRRAVLLSLLSDRRLHTHTTHNTHTHMVFYGCTGTFHRRNGFILYKLYVLLPYTYPTPKLSPHSRRCIIFSLKKTHSVWFISV